METQAILKGVRLSAQKGRLVADLVRGKPVEQALSILSYTPKKSAQILKKVVESANFIDDLGADSLDTVELVMAFEEEFGIEIPDDAAETIQTVGDAVTFIKGAV